MELVRRESVTPDDGGILDYLGERFAADGWRVRRMDAGGVRNLYVDGGPGPARFCLAGHVDTVPVGDGWTRDPFGAVVEGGLLYGRGACDMKAGVAALVTAALSHGPASGVSVLLTSDEEGPAMHGTVYVLDELTKRGELPRAALVAEPTSEAVLGDAYKIGRRGSLTGRLTIPGIQGHVAYPDRADNAAHRAAALLTELATTVWDSGDGEFAPTSFQAFEIASGGVASNVVPGTARLAFNFRFGPASTSEGLRAKVGEIAARHAPGAAEEWMEGALPFRGATPDLRAALEAAVGETLGLQPRATTSGGTSDARFFAAAGVPVVEFGVVPLRMHGADEAVVADAAEGLVKVLANLTGRMM